MLRNSLNTLAAALLLVIASGAITVHAQDYTRIAPREPTVTKSPAIKPSALASASGPSSPPGNGANRVLLESLKGLEFVPKLDAATEAGLPANAASSIAAPGLPLLADPAFTRQVKPFLGQPLTLADLHEITQLATNGIARMDGPSCP